MHRMVLLAIDLACVIVATVASLFLRDNLDLSLERLVILGPYVLISIVSAAFSFALLGVSRGIWRFASLPDYLRVVFAVFLAVSGAVAAGFAWDRLETVPRAIPILQILLTTALMTTVRVGTRLRHSQRSRTPAAEIANLFKGETVLVLGLSWIADLFLKSIRETGGEYVSIAGVIGPKNQHRGRLFQTYPILGTPEELQTILKQLEVHGVYVDRVVVATPLQNLSSDAREELERVETGSAIVIDYFAERLGLVRSDEEGGDTPVALNERRAGELHLSLEEHADVPSLKRRLWVAKRLFDFTMAAVAIMLAAPLFVVVALLALFDVGTPVLFWQQRPGRFGRRFKVYKFRTMKAAHDRHGRKLTDDERLSAIGRFIRRTRLDELPQLFNILVGQMSFVGPRPLLPIDQAEEYSARLAVRPGLTGWAQVNGGRDISAADKAAMDVWYVHNASPLLDLKIILATVHMVIFGERPNPTVVRAAWRYLQQQGFAAVSLSGERTGTEAQQAGAQRVA